MIKIFIENQVAKRTSLGRLFRFSNEVLTLTKFHLGFNTFRTLNLQFTNSCNLNCKWCGLKKGEDIMSEETLIKTLEKIKKYHIKNLNLWNGGEILMHPDIINLLKIIKKYKNFKVNLLTNAMLLTPNLSKKIIELGVVDEMMFSMDGGSGKECERLRSGVKWNILKRNIKYFLDLNKNIKTSIISVIPLEKPLNISWMDKEFKDILNSVDHYRLVYPEQHLGGLKPSYSKDFEFLKFNKKICIQLLKQAVVNQNGKILPCCYDISSDCVIGDIEEGFIFNSEKRKKMVKTLLKGERNKIPLCKNCYGFSMKNIRIKNPEKRKKVY